MTERNRGSIALARLGIVQLELARRLDVSTGIVAYWITGERKPGLPNRKLLLERYKIPIEAWDQAPEPPSAPKLAASAEWGESSVNGRIEMLETMVEQLIRSVTADTTTTPLEKAKVMSTCAHTLGTIRRLKGEEIAESRVLRLPKWIAIKRELVGALAPFPDALESVLEALDAFERKTG